MAGTLIRRFGVIGTLGTFLALPAAGTTVTQPAPARTTSLARMAGYTSLPAGMVPIIRAFVQNLNTNQDLRNQLDPAMARLLLQPGFNANDPVTQKLLAPALMSADPAAVDVDSPKNLLNFFNGRGSSARSEYAEAVRELQEEIEKLPAASQMDQAQRQRLFELLYFLRRLEILSAYAEPDPVKKGTAQRKVADRLAAANKALREKVNPFMDEKVGGMLAQADQFILYSTVEQFAGVFASAYGFQHVNGLRAYDPNAQGANPAAADAALAGINALSIANDNLAQSLLVANLGEELKKGDSAYVTKVRLVLDKIAVGSAFGSVKSLFIQTLLGTGASADVLQKIDQVTAGSQDKNFIQAVVGLLLKAETALSEKLQAALAAAAGLTDAAAQAGLIQAANEEAAKDQAAINALLLKLLSAAPTTIATPEAPARTETEESKDKKPGMLSQAWSTLRQRKFLMIFLILLNLAVFNPFGVRDWTISRVSGLFAPAALVSTETTTEAKTIEQPVQNFENPQPLPEEPQTGDPIKRKKRD